MVHFTYFGVLAFCVLGTAWLELFLKVGVYRQWRRVVMSIAPGFAVFVLWDRAAIEVGQFYFNDKYLTGIRIGGMPIEELAFFIVIPLCGLLTIEAVRSQRPRWAIGDEAPQEAMPTRKGRS